jgi:hypothetical protein
MSSSESASVVFKLLGLELAKIQTHIASLEKLASSVASSSLVQKLDKLLVEIDPSATSYSEVYLKLVADESALEAKIEAFLNPAPVVKS